MPKQSKQRASVDWSSPLPTETRAGKPDSSQAKGAEADLENRDPRFVKLYRSKVLSKDTGSISTSTETSRPNFTVSSLLAHKVRKELSSLQQLRAAFMFSIF